MRADGAGAKTWLLGALALWAVCAWLLALFGLGGRVEPLPEDASLLQRLPQPGEAPAERLGPLAQYAEIGQRPLFSDDRRPHPFFINPEGDEDSKNDFDFVLTSILDTPGFKMAILQPTGGGESVRVKVGAAPETAQSWTLASIGPRSAVFNGPEGERKLELRVFDGTGGEPPSVAPPSMAASTEGAPRARPPPPPPGGMAAPQPTPADGADSAADATQPSPKPAARSDSADSKASADQVEAIRKRIEERRAKLRQQSQTPPPAGKP